MEGQKPMAIKIYVIATAEMDKITSQNKTVVKRRLNTQMLIA